MPARYLARIRCGAALLARRMARDERGNIAMLFALLAVPVVVAVGLGVDIVRAYRVQMITQSSLDQAVLAAGRAAQVNPSTPMTSASTAASNYWNTTAPKDVVSSTITFAADNTNTSFTLTATSWVQTPFLGAMWGLWRHGGEAGAPTACITSKYNCLKVSNTTTASIAAGGNGGSNVEVSVMLDVTGSMSGTKIQTLISASKDLVDTIVWADQSKYTSRVALAPFAPAVNVGSAYYTALTNESQSYTTSCGWWSWGCSSTTGTYAPCVVERTGTQAYTDAAPGSGSWLVSWQSATGSTSSNCTPNASIVPLTSNKTTLKAAIDTLTARGATAGQLGTAFAWYLISPNWSTIWGTSAAPGVYADLTTMNSNGAPKLRKFAVLMTDGTYNTIQGQSYGDNSSQATTAASRALSICSGMKTAGIEVFTVGFQLDTNAAKTLLTNCATDSSHFYDAGSESALSAAFRDIALKISSLRLTN